MNYVHYEYLILVGHDNLKNLLRFDSSHIATPWKPKIKSLLSLTFTSFIVNLRFFWQQKLNYLSITISGENLILHL